MKIWENGTVAAAAVVAVASFVAAASAAVAEFCEQAKEIGPKADKEPAAHGLPVLTVLVSLLLCLSICPLFLSLLVHCFLFTIAFVVNLSVLLNGPEKTMRATPVVIGAAVFFAF